MRDAWRVMHDAPGQPPATRDADCTAAGLELGSGPDRRDTPGLVSACLRARGPRHAGRGGRGDADGCVACQRRSGLLSCGRPPCASASARERFSPGRTPWCRPPAQAAGAVLLRRLRDPALQPEPREDMGLQLRVAEEPASRSARTTDEQCTLLYIAGQGGNRGDGPQDALLQMEGDAQPSPSVMRSLVMLREAASEEIARCVSTDGGWKDLASVDVRASTAEGSRRTS
jgi:hypothetical protein